MKLGWKILIPVSLAWLLMIATIRVWRTQGGSTPVYIVAGVIVVVLLIVAWAAAPAAQRRRRLRTEGPKPPPAAGGEGAAIPVPPMDLPHYHGARLSPVRAVGADPPGNPAG